MQKWTDAVGTIALFFLMVGVGGLDGNTLAAVSMVAISVIIITALCIAEKNKKKRIAASDRWK